MKARQLGHTDGRTDRRGIHIFTGGFLHNAWSDYKFADSRLSEILTYFKT